MRKGVNSSLLQTLKNKNEELKKAKASFETLQALQNSMSKEFGQYKREGKDISELKARVDANKIVIAEALDIQRRCQEELEKIPSSVVSLHS